MSIRDWFGVTFGLAPFRDYDLPHEPSTVPRPDWTAFRADLNEIRDGITFTTRFLVDLTETVDELTRWVDRYDPLVEPVTEVKDWPGQTVALLSEKRKGRQSRT